AVHHLNRLGLKARSITQRQQTALQISFWQRRQLIEQRQNQLRVQHQHQKLKAEDQREAPQPPARSRPSHEGKQRPKEWKSDHERQRQTLDLVRDPQARSALVETKFGLQSKLFPPFKRQRRKRKQDARRKDEESVRPHR